VSSRRGWLASAATGALLWTAATLIGGQREPWDSENYWSIWLPTALLLSAVLGYLFPERPWRWPLALMLMQMPVIAILLGAIGPLMAVGFALLVVYSLPGMFTAWLGSRLRRCFEREEQA